MLDEMSHLSLYYQLKQIFLDKLHTGEWAVGSRIPTELELSGEYRVSRSTIRQALRDLELDGRLYRKQGKGTFVTVPKIAQRLAHFYSFSEEIKRLGYQPSTQILSFDTTTDLAPFLSGDANGLFYRIKRLRLANGEPFALETSYIPCDLFAGLTPDYVEQHGLYAAMRSLSSLSPDSATESFDAVSLPTPEANLLHTRPQSPALRLKRVTYAQDSIVEYCLSLIRGDRYEYTVSLK